MASLIEAPSRIEPCLLEQTSGVLLDLVADLTDASARLGARLHPRSAVGLADLVRIMNCYYSNLIEGHNTAPRDIERAMADQFAPDTERRNLQLEARAHIRVHGTSTIASPPAPSRNRPRRISPARFTPPFTPGCPRTSS